MAARIAEEAEETAKAESEKARAQTEQVKITNAAAALTAAKKEKQDVPRAAAGRGTESHSMEEGDNDRLTNAGKGGGDTESVVPKATSNTKMSDGLRSRDPREDVGEQFLYRSQKRLRKLRNLTKIKRQYLTEMGILSV